MLLEDSLFDHPILGTIDAHRMAYGKCFAGLKSFTFVNIEAK